MLGDLFMDYNKNGADKYNSSQLPYGFKILFGLLIMTPRTFHYLLNPDPDPDPDAAYQVNPDQDPIRIQGFDDQKLKKKYSRKFI
jgi:hypothetical protein